MIMLTTETPERCYRAFKSGVEAILSELNPPACFKFDEDLIQRLYQKAQETFDESRLYYEAHITIAPPSRELQDRLEVFAERHEWRVSTFLKVTEGPWPDAFISARDKSLVSIRSRLISMRQLLEVNGYDILRVKIEDTLFDTKKGDDV